MIERARRRTRDDTLTLNHSGVAVAAVPGVSLNPIVVYQNPATLEFVCARVMSSTLSYVVLLVYRPRSSADNTNTYGFLQSATTMKIDS
jgi:hypothetical protein